MEKHGIANNVLITLFKTYENVITKCLFFVKHNNYLLRKKNYLVLLEISGLRAKFIIVWT